MNTSMPAVQDDERRYGPDRRLIHPLLADWKWAFRGRRRASRRAEDDAWPDVYDPRTVATVFAVLALSALDATFTLRLLETGAVREANPFMDFLIRHDVQVFVNLKTALTASGLLFMVVASRARFGPIRVGTLLRGVLALYVMLIGYELVLLWKVGALG